MIAIMSDQMIEQLRRLASNEMSFGEGEVVFAQGSKVSLFISLFMGQSGCCGINQMARRS